MRAFRAFKELIADFYFFWLVYGICAMATCFWFTSTTLTRFAIAFIIIGLLWGGSFFGFSFYFWLKKTWRKKPKDIYLALEE